MYVNNKCIYSFHILLFLLSFSGENEEKCLG